MHIHAPSDPRIGIPETIFTLCHSLLEFAIPFTVYPDKL